MSRFSSGTNCKRGVLGKTGEVERQRLAPSFSRLSASFSMKGPRAEGTAAPCRIGDVVCRFNGNEALSQLKDHGFAILKVVQNRSLDRPISSAKSSMYFSHIPRLKRYHTLQYAPFCQSRQLGNFSSALLSTGHPSSRSHGVFSTQHPPENYMLP
ncbi:Uncharacterized protein LW93_2926 [Fusarium fujikuroi]|nr:Uncharacterized protein LW93_2926 [Fusarium fujikuroi]